jgi:uncharacterized protein (TIGR02594 family)
MPSTKAPAIQPPWLAIAQAELGVSETRGRQHTPKIVEYHKATELKATDDETPWCSAFVNYCMKKVKLDRTHSALARSWLSWGVPLKVPAYGCVVVLKRGRSSWSGHVGFYMGDNNASTIKVLGGNQGDKVSIANFPKSKVLGYRWI